MRGVCGSCGSDIRRTYSVASSDEDDYLATCDCPIEWKVVLLQVVIIGLFLGLVVLGFWCKS